IGMAGDLVVVGNGIDVMGADSERQQPQQLQDQVAWPNAVKVLGQVEVQVEDPGVVSALDSADEQFGLGPVGQRKGHRERPEIALEQAEGQMALARQPGRIVDHYPGVVAYGREVREKDFVVAVDLEARELLNGVEVAGNALEAGLR